MRAVCVAGLIALLLVTACSSNGDGDNRVQDVILDDSVADDADVIEALRRADVDLSEPQTVHHYLYLPTEESAQAGCEELRSEGFAVEVRPAAIGNDWLCFATRESVIDTASIAVLRARMEDVAAEFNGEYDGWEVAVAP
jgi:hypothetical protein